MHEPLIYLPHVAAGSGDHGQYCSTKGSKMTLREKYPDAFEDDKGTIWISQTAAESADWTFEHGDAFLDGTLGWSWADAEENWALCQLQAKRKAFWQSHPHLLSLCRFLRRRWGFVRLFSSVVWRDWYGRISWSTAWTISRDIWLRGNR